MILQTGKNSSSRLRLASCVLRLAPALPSGRSGRTTHNARRTGLTLLEVLVAVSIFAICVVAIFRVYISCFEARLKAENLAKAIGVSLDAMEYAEEFGIPLSDSEELAEDICRFTWKFTENDVDTEHYPKLKEIILDTIWEQGKHNGRFSLITYYWKTTE